CHFPWRMSVAVVCAQAKKSCTYSSLLRPIERSSLLHCIKLPRRSQDTEEAQPEKDLTAACYIADTEVVSGPCRCHKRTVRNNSDDGLRAFRHAGLKEKGEWYECINDPTPQC